MNVKIELVTVMLYADMFVFVGWSFGKNKMSQNTIDIAERTAQNILNIIAPVIRSSVVAYAIRKHRWTML